MQDTGSINLTESERRQLNRASDMMLQPFAKANIAEYLRAAAAEIKPLADSFAAVCGHQRADGSIDITSDDYSENDVAEFARWKLADAGTQRALASGVEVFSIRSVVGLDWDGLEQDPMMNGWYYPRNVHDALGVLLEWPEDGAFVMLEFHHRTFGTRRMGREGEAILGLLLPSLRAGVRLMYSAGVHRMQLARDMEKLGVALCVCGHDGSIAHCASSVQTMLVQDPDRASVLRRVSMVAGEVASVARRTRRIGPAPLPRTHEIVTTRTASYRVSGALATHEMQFGDADILVTVARLTRMPLTSADVARRFQMTAREADVSLGLARGDRNTSIAAALGISPHTVRRHTERILAKLGVTSRAEAAAKLQSE